jgi:SAM-dependent methyltransferase
MQDVTMSNPGDSWTSGDAYQRFMGRWSPFLAELFVPWLAVPAGRDWLDVGCGTGALTRTILSQAAPAKVVGVDPSEAFVNFARQNIGDPRVQFKVGGAQELPVEDASFDVAAAGLVLNFVPDPAAALAEIKRAVRPGGRMGAYVWDYSEGMRMIRVFFDAATALVPAAAEVDEGLRFTLARPGALAQLFNAAGLHHVQTRALEFTMQFLDFNDYWDPFKGGVGPAPTYLASLPPEKQAALEAEVRRRLPIAADGSIQLAARAWAVLGVKLPLEKRYAALAA